MSGTWEEEYGRMMSIVDYLVRRQKEEREEQVPDTWRGIMISDKALGEQDSLPPPSIGGGVGEVSDAAREVLQLPSKTSTWN